MGAEDILLKVVVVVPFKLCHNGVNMSCLSWQRMIETYKESHTDLLGELHIAGER